MEYAAENPGGLDSPLTDVALEQLENIELPPLHHPLLFSSDLGRARRSACIISKKIGCDLIVDPRLRERRFGVLEGQVIDAGSHLAAEWASYHHRYQQKIQNVRGVESEDAFEQRIRSFLADLICVSRSSWHGEHCDRGTWRMAEGLYQFADGATFLAWWPRN
ncbi:histidine phosphatase family protein [Vibrio sp. PP-XX7]